MLPSRRRGKLSKAARSARNLAIADAAIALARDRVATKLPGVEPRRGPGRARALLIGGAAAAVLTAALLKRDKVAGLLPSRTEAPEPSPEPAPTPAPSNYDVGGPPANTATPVPAPDATAPPAVDEAAEEAAAAAEARNVGGPKPQYAGGEPPSPTAAPETPLAESGEGESEGQEQTEAERDRSINP